MRTYLVVSVAASMMAIHLRAPADTPNLLHLDQWTPVAPGAKPPGFSAFTEPIHGNGYRITISKATEPFFATQVTQMVAAAVPQGDRIRLSLWGRSKTNNPLRTVVEKSSAPYTAVAEWTGTLGPEWKEITATGTSPGFGAGGLSVRL